MEIAGGIVLLVLAAGCLLFPVLNADLFLFLAAGLVTGSALLLWREVFSKPQGVTIIAAAACTVIALMLWFHRLQPTAILMGLFSFYMLFNAFAEFVQMILNFQERSASAWQHLLMTVLYGGLSLAAFLMRHWQNETLIMRLFGCYLLTQAWQLFYQLFVSSRPASSRATYLKRWTSMPVYVVSVLPSLILRRILSRKMKGTKLNFDQHKNDEPVNLRVFIHTGLKDEQIFGHMTFAYKGVMFSYGNYDKSEEKLFRTIGPGVIFTAPADIYVNNCCIYEGSTLFEYGLHLNEEQEAKLQATLERIHARTYRWYCPLEKAFHGLKSFDKYKDDYVNRLWYRTGAKFRKFYGTRWKTYWVFGDNCSLFAAELLSQIGAGILASSGSGVCTPGEYFQFFEEAYSNPSSNVVYRSWHSAEVPKTLFPTLA